MQLAEHDTALTPENQAEAFKTLSGAKHELNGALGKFRTQTEELESNEKRLSLAREGERDLLASEMDEEEQVSRHSQLVSLQRLLESKIERGRNQLETVEDDRLRLKHTPCYGARYTCK